MATISRFPPGALFYGPVMSTKLAMNKPSQLFLPPTAIQTGITFNLGERIPIDMERPPQESFLIYDPRKNDNMKLLIDYLVENRFYRNPTVFLKKLIKLAEDETASVRRTQIYCSPIDYKIRRQDTTLVPQASRDSLYFPLGVNGWSTGSPFSGEWNRQEILGDPALIKPKLIRGLFLFFNNPEGRQIISPLDIQSLQHHLDELQQQQSILGQQAQKEALSQQQQEEASRINQSIIQIRRLSQLSSAINNTLAGGQEFFKETDFLLKTHNPFWEMILISLGVRLLNDYNNVSLYPFYDFQYIAPKNLITDQVSSGNSGVEQIFTALNICGIHEGEVCYASKNGAYLPTLQTARAADHAASQHQQYARHRINQAMRTYDQMRTYAGYNRLRASAIGNPLYALNLGFTIHPSTGFISNHTPITVIQRRAKTSLSKERDPAFLFGMRFYEMITNTTCSSCEPCSNRVQTPTDLLHTCLPTFNSPADVSKRTRTCKFTCSGCSNTSPLLKWQKGPQNVTNKGSKTRAKTCFCDCYQEAYYSPRILQGEQQKYQARRDQLCRGGTVGPLNMVHDNMSGPYVNDEALYKFIMMTKQTWMKDGLPKKYAQFIYSVGVCTKKCGCQGKCIGNRWRAEQALVGFQGISANISADTLRADAQFNWVSLYITAGSTEEEKQNNMTNVYCLVSKLFEQMVIDTAGNTIIIKEPLNSMLQDVFGQTTNAAVIKILFDQIFWSHSYITSTTGGQIFFPTPAGSLPFDRIITNWQKNLGQNFLTPTSLFLLLKFLLNSIVIGVPSVKNLTLYQTANVETVIGPIQLNPKGIFEHPSAKSEEVDYNGTSAAGASGKIMDALKNNASAWHRPTSASGYKRQLVKRIAAEKGKEIGDYGQQITAFTGEAVCLTGDLNAFNRPGLAKKVTVFCKNTMLTSKEMTENVRERGDDCFQLFSRPNATNPVLSVVAIQVLQVAPVPQDVMVAASGQLQAGVM